MQVTVDANEHLLNEVFCLLPVANSAIDEVQKARLISLNEFLKRALFATQKGRDDFSIVHRAKLFADRRPLLGSPLQCDVSHGVIPRAAKGCARTTRFGLFRDAIFTLVKAGVMPDLANEGAFCNLLLPNDLRLSDAPDCFGSRD